MRLVNCRIYNVDTTYLRYVVVCCNYIHIFVKGVSYIHSVLNFQLSSINRVPIYICIGIQYLCRYLYLPQAPFSNFLSKFFSGTNYFERPAIRSNMYYMWCSRSSSVKSNLSLVNDQFHLAPILSVHMSFFCRFPLILMCVYVSGVRRCIGGRTQLGWGCW